MRNSAVVLLAAALSASGCARRVVDFTALSTRNLTLRGSRGPRVEGTHCAHTVLFIPLGEPNMEDATDRALSSAGAEFDALENGVVKARSFYIPFIYGQSCFDVEGTAVSTARLPPDSTTTSPPVVSPEPIPDATLSDASRGTAVANDSTLSDDGRPRRGRWRTRQSRRFR